MKKSLLYLVLLLSVISCTNYYTVRLQEDTLLYSSSEGETSATIIPKDTEVFLSSKANKKNYSKLKWGIITVGSISLTTQRMAVIPKYRHILPLDHHHQAMIQGQVQVAPCR